MKNQARLRNWNRQSIMEASLPAGSHLISPFLSSSRSLINNSISGAI